MVSRRTRIADSLFADSDTKKIQEPRSEIPLTQLSEHVRVYRASMKYTQKVNTDEVFETNMHVLDIDPLVLQSGEELCEFGNVWTLYGEPLVVDDEETPTNVSAKVGDIVCLRARLKEGRKGWKLRANTMKIVKHENQWSTLYSLS